MTYFDPKTYVFKPKTMIPDPITINGKPLFDDDIAEIAGAVVYDAALCGLGFCKVDKDGIPHHVPAEQVIFNDDA